MKRWLGAISALACTHSALAEGDASVATDWTPWAVVGWLLIVVGPLAAGASVAESKKGAGAGVIVTVVGALVAAANGGLNGDARDLWLPIALASFTFAVLLTWFDRWQRKKLARIKDKETRQAPKAVASAPEEARMPLLTIEDKYILEGAKSFPVAGIPTLYVRYQKASGEEVEHEIDVTRIALEDGEIARMTAKRKDAAGLRTFLLPRVQEVAIAATGEVVDDLEGLLRAGAERAMK